MQQRIPIEASQFHCPSCNGAERLEYLIQRIAEGDKGFEFEVLIQCKKCSKKRSLKKFLKSVMDIVKFEIKPTGIEIKKG